MTETCCKLSKGTFFSVGDLLNESNCSLNDALSTETFSEMCITGRSFAYLFDVLITNNFRGQYMQNY